MRTIGLLIVAIIVLDILAVIFVTDEQIYCSEKDTVTTLSMYATAADLFAHGFRADQAALLHRPRRHQSDADRPMRSVAVELARTASS